MKLFKLLNMFILSVQIMSIMPASANYRQDNNSGIYGRVLHDGEGAPFVTVHIKGTSTGTSTDADGYFRLDGIPSGRHIIMIQGIGYENKESTMRLAPGRIMEIEFNIEQDFLLMEQVVVSGSRVGALRYLPGSAGILTSRELRAIAPLSGNEVLRTITGVHVVEEEGAGLRANIGIRGLDPDKSRNVLMLEDGIPVALGPYGEPEMYFTPGIDRMSGIEVLKGSGSILYGPQTIGGVINYITADPPVESSGFARFSGGQGGYYTGNLGYGNTLGNTGFTVNYLRRQAENLGQTQFILDDINSKIRFDASPRSDIMVKLGIYNENSNSTYVGLTQSMFDADKYDFARIAPDDRLEVRRYSIGVTHNFRANENLQLNTAAYAYTTTRNWKRQDFTYDAGASNLTGINWGDNGLRDGAIYLRNSTGNRNRQFEVAGIEPRLTYRYSFGGRENILDAGTRLLYERAYEQRVDGTSATATSGNLRNDEVRTGHALSAFAQNKMIVNDRLSLTAGIRAEALQYERRILRSNHADTDIRNTTRVAEIIPGGGFNFNFTDGIGLFGGVHRGFAPPRIKDAISNDGTDLELDAEKSWNYELGMRNEFSNIAKFNVTLFLMEFSNQVIPVSESSGGAGAGLINGGRTNHRGIEGELLLDISVLSGMRGNMVMAVNSTITESNFSGDRFVAQYYCHHVDEVIYMNIKGNRTPYAPAFTSSAYLQYETDRGFGFRLKGQFTGSQYTDVLNTGYVNEWFEKSAADDHNYYQATANGRIGMMPSYFIMDVSAWYSLSSGIAVNMQVRNLFDQRYIVSRRPQGIRVGLPRMVNAGISYNF